MRKVAQRLFHSATVTSWVSYGMRAAALPITLPLLLTRLTATELNVWYMVATVLSFTVLSDLGFSHTFYRLIAWGMNGATRKDLLTADLSNRSEQPAGKPDWSAIESVFSTMLYVYLVLGATLLALLLTGGTIALQPAIDATDQASAIWKIWPLIAISSSIFFVGSVFGVYLQGTNCIAEMRRWDIVIQIPAILTQVLILILNGSLIALLLAQQFWNLIAVARNYWLCKSVLEGHFRYFNKLKFDTPLFFSALKPSWRAGIGAAASLGGTRLSIILFSRMVSPASSASFLFGMNLMDKLVDFSMVPFYVKIPTFAGLTFRKARSELISRARYAMTLSHLCLVIPGILIGIFAAPILGAIGSHINFMPSTIWAAFLLAIWTWREGAMHIQLYSTTNHIIWHWANGISSLLMVSIVYFSIKWLNIWAIPIAYLVAYGLVYTPICLFYSLRHLKIGLLAFERANIVFPAALMIYFLATESGAI